MLAMQWLRLSNSLCAALECELDRTYVSAVERSRWNVSLSNMERLAKALGVEVWTLLRAPQRS